jgi:Mg/Co/Ni transporter MgtE
MLVEGIVMDTNDPQASGRVRVYCPGFGDLPGTKTEDLPWCRYMSPFGGTINSKDMSRGPADTKSSGSISYGMWALPKIGAAVIVTRLNDDNNNRVYIGCIHSKLYEHTLPQGRFLEDDGPKSSTEEPIQPLYDNLKKAFGDYKKFEFKTRAMEHSVSGISDPTINLKLSESKKSDTHSGYKQSRIHPDLKYKSTGMNFESQTFSMTTPGLHTILMDDSQDNGRIRIRTTCGHNVLLDDTNERIYINTAEGNNWIEMDQDGVIDIYTAQSVNIHSDKDINLNAKQSIRMHADNIHLRAETSIFQTAKKDIDFIADNISSKANNQYSIQTKLLDTISKETTNISAKDINAVAKKSAHLVSDVVSISANTYLDLEGADINLSAKKGIRSNSDFLRLTAKAVNVIGTVVTNVGDNIVHILGKKALQASGSIFYSEKGFSPLPTATTTTETSTDPETGTSTSTSTTELSVDLTDKTKTISPEIANIDASKPAADLGLSDIVDNDIIAGTLPEKSSPPANTGIDLVNLSDIKSILSKLPISDVVSTLANISLTTSGEYLASTDPTTLGQIIKEPALTTTLANIDSTNKASMVDNANRADLRSMTDNMSDNELSGFIGDIPTDKTGKVMSSMSTDTLHNMDNASEHLDNIPSEDLEDILSDPNNLDLIQQLGDPSSSLSNITPEGIGSILTNSDDNSIVNQLPPEMVGKAITSMDNESAADVLNNTSANNLGSICTNIPSDKLDILKDMVPNISNIGKMGPTVTTGLSQFANMDEYMRQADFDHAVSMLSDADIGSLVNLPAGTVDNTFKQLHGATAGEILDRTNNREVALSKLTPDTITKNFTDMPGSRMTSIVDKLSDQAVGNLVSTGNMSGIMNNSTSGDVNKVLTKVHETNNTANMLESADNADFVTDRTAEVDLNNYVDKLSDNEIQSLLDKSTDSAKNTMFSKLSQKNNTKVLSTMSKEEVQKLSANLSTASLANVMNALKGVDIANPKNPKDAFYPNRIPAHEPWARTYTKADNTMDPKYKYDDPNVGKDNKTRNKFWSR